MNRTPVLAIAMALAWTVEAAGQTPEQAGAGLLFKFRCLSCHQAPDLNFATDRAWLDQVNRTA